MSPCIRYLRAFTLGLASWAGLAASVPALAQGLPTHPDRYSGAGDAAVATAPVGTLSAYAGSTASAGVLSWPGKAAFASNPAPAPQVQAVRFAPAPNMQVSPSAPQPMRPSALMAPPAQPPGPYVPAPPAVASRAAPPTSDDGLPGPPVSPWYVRFAAPPPSGPASAPSDAPAPARQIASTSLRPRAALPQSIYDPPKAAGSDGGGAAADAIPPQFFSPSADQPDPAGPSPVYKSNTSSGTSTAAHALQPVEDGSTLGGN